MEERLEDRHVLLAHKSSSVSYPVYRRQGEGGRCSFSSFSQPSFPQIPSTPPSFLLIDQLPTPLQLPTAKAQHKPTKLAKHNLQKPKLWVRSVEWRKDASHVEVKSSFTNIHSSATLYLFELNEERVNCVMFESVTRYRVKRVEASRSAKQLCKNKKK